MEIWITKIRQELNKKCIQPMIVKYRKKKYQLPPMSIIASDCSGGCWRMIMDWH